MRVLIAQCHLGLGKVYRQAGKRDQAQAQVPTAATARIRLPREGHWSGPMNEPHVSDLLRVLCGIPVADGRRRSLTSTLASSSARAG